MFSGMFQSMFFKISQWLESRTGIVGVAKKVSDAVVPAGFCGCRYLPIMIAFAALLQAITGVLLWAHYSSSMRTAWESIFYVQYSLPGGWLVRGIHHYSAQVFVAMLGIYLVTRVLIGRYRAPREFVFWTAIILLLLSLGSCLTGDLLQWTLPSVSATLVRVRFLQMIPEIGDDLFKIAAGGAQFGALTIPRFLTLHILIAWKIFALCALWLFFDHRASLLAVARAREKKEKENCECNTQQKSSCCCVTKFKSLCGCGCSFAGCNTTEVASFWSCNMLRISLACLFTMLIVLGLVFQKPLLQRANLYESIYGGEIDFSQPRGAYFGAKIGAPADITTFDDAARPEWSFRAVYHLANLKLHDIPFAGKTFSENTEIFPGTVKWIPIFVIPSCVIIYLFLMPIIGRICIGHTLNVLVMIFLATSFVYLTYCSYHHDYIDESMAGFRAIEEWDEARAARAIELANSPEGIPPEGMLTRLKTDPLSAGPILFKQHCATCHPFEPLAGTARVADFLPIPCDERSAPNLYAPLRKEWIHGFLNAEKAKSNDYFGKTKFARGTMVSTYLNTTLPEILEEGEEESRLEEIAVVLLAEAQHDKIPADGTHRTQAELDLFTDFSCVDCHRFYNMKKEPPISAPDLRGYMSREWMIGFIADPTQKTFYGPDSGRGGNDRMMSYHKSETDKVLTLTEIATLVDWLRGTWFRANAK